MYKTVWAIVRNGRIELEEPAGLSEGARVLVTLVGDEDGQFWREASQKSLDAVWDNPEDDVYAELLEE